jgi:hypothetical protein
MCYICYEKSFHNLFVILVTHKFCHFNLVISPLHCNHHYHADFDICHDLIIKQHVPHLPMTLGWAARRSAPRAHLQGRTPSRCTTECATPLHTSCSRTLTTSATVVVPAHKNSWSVSSDLRGRLGFRWTMSWTT